MHHLARPYPDDLALAVAVILLAYTTVVRRMAFPDGFMTVVGLIVAAISKGPPPLAGRGRPDGGALLAMAGKPGVDLQIRLAPQAMMAFDAQHRRRLRLHCRGGAAGAHGPCHSEEGHHFPAAGEWR